MISQKKIFVSGIYGSGKTTFTERYSQSEGVQHLKFDEIYKYVSPDRLDLVYEAMSGSESFIMDALPLNEEDSSWSRFADYVRQNDAAFVIVRCPVDVWYKERLCSKASFDTASEEEHRKWYGEFYSVTLPRIFSQLNPKAVYSYDSGKSRTLNVERMEF